ncbi:unnamed protein product [Heligmosomoides polygyrus]|uniref:HTH_48 domain-containing protein n=1 Tax=Heligmosomoides polygyrus TaxID=6339 RepID=A0A183G0Y3_HELPZ|nr:unnamed protein product [Heligmosomoides polygyrus]
MDKLAQLGYVHMPHPPYSSDISPCDYHCILLEPIGLHGRKGHKDHPYEGVRYFAAALGCSRSTVDNGLRSLGMVKKLGQWLPHELTDDNLRRRVDICTQLLS